MVNKDLILKVDELTCEKEMLEGEMEAVLQAKTTMEDKSREMEEELKRSVNYCPCCNHDSLTTEHSNTI